MVPEFLAFLVVLIAVWFWWGRRGQYWEREGLPSLPASFPFGNIGDLVLMKKNLGDIIRDIYRSFPGEKACGFYKFHSPCLVLRDRELIKTVLVKEFYKFKNNDFRVSWSLDPLLALNPFTIHTDEWKKVRAIQLPMQTPNKVRLMCPNVLESAKYLSNYIKLNPNKEIEAKDLASKYTGDSVASCAFGLDSNSFENENDFGNAGKGELFASGFLDNLAVISAMLAPVLSRILGLRVLRKDLSDYFIEVVKNASEYRIKNNLRRNDFLQQLIDKNSSEDKPVYSNIEMAGHCMTFYMDGYETTGIVIAWTLWELAVNPEEQEKLRKEIFSVRHNIEDYEVFTKLPFLDAVVSESLRLHPPIQSITRVCNEETTLDCRPDGGSVKIKEGMSVIVPILALHTDERFFPEPEKFIPSRFLEPESIPKFAYIPFGEGPRICVGKKFSLMQVKAAIISVLLGHRIETTQNQVSLDPMSTFLHNPKGGLWLKFIPYENNANESI